MSSSAAPEESFERQLALQTLVARLASSFIRLSSDEVDQGIVDALAQIAAFLGIDRAAVFRLHDRATLISLTHEWHAPQLGAGLGHFDNIPLAEFPSVTAWLTENDNRYVEVKDASDGHASELARLAQFAGLQSFALLPVEADEGYGGMVAFGWEASGCCLKDSERVLLELVGKMVRNLMRRRRIEDQRRANEGRFRSLMESNVVGVVLARRDGTVVAANDIACERAAFTQAGVAAGDVHWPDLLPITPDSDYVKQLELLESQGFTPTFQATFQKGDGERLPVLTNLTRLEEADSADFMAVLVDMTTRERIEAELQFRSQFDALVANLSTRIVNLPTPELDPAIRDALAEIGTFHGVDRCSFFLASPDLSSYGIAHHWFGDLPDADASSLQKLPMSEFVWWKQRLAQGSTVHIADVTKLPDDAAAERELLSGRGIRTLVAVPVLTGREMSGFMTLVTINRTKEWSEEALSSLRLLADILGHALERQHLDRAMRDANVLLEDSVRARTLQLELSNQELAAFSHAVSHDLRAPLRSIDGYSELLLQGEGADLNEDGRHLLERVRAATQRMGELIRALLQVSNLSQASVTWEDVDLSKEAQTVAAELSAASPERQVEFRIAPNLKARGETALLAIVLENLIGNAWKFTAKHSTATIEVGDFVRGGEQVFFVRDDGAGFDPDFSSKLFGTFERLHQTHEFTGHGIGLATVERIIRLHGGRVWADGQVEKGAVFQFTLNEAEATKAQRSSSDSKS